MSTLNELFKGVVKKNPVTTNTSSKYNALQMKQMVKKTENGDNSFNTTGNKLLDIYFFAPYFEKRLNQLKIGNSDREKLLAMFMRDPRFGQGRRDLGRELMKQADVTPQDVITAGRFDDLLYNPTNENIQALYEAVKSGNELAKKWCPRLSSKDSEAAQALAKIWYPDVPAQTAYKLYRKLIKVDTTENKLSRHREDEINFEQVPSLAAKKYFATFFRKQEERFKAYIESVKKGEAKLNVATNDVYEIYKTRNQVDAQLFFDAYLKKNKIEISCLPILDVSGSMGTGNESIRAKATSVAHFLSKCSTYCNNKVVTFSANPILIDMGKPYTMPGGWGRATEFKPNYNLSAYMNEMNSLDANDEVANTDFGKVMKLLSGLSEFPDWLVCMTDMEFDNGSCTSKDATMKIFKQYGAKTKIIWWNFNDRNKTAPEVDEYGNIFMSGYNVNSLKFLKLGFDAEQFLNEMLTKYAEAIKSNYKV